MTAEDVTELQEEVAELRRDLFMEQSARAEWETLAKERGQSMLAYRSMLREAQDIPPPRPSRVARGLLALAALGMAFLVFALGYTVGAPDGAVCHSVTEDSDITDCDYRDGGWYQK